MRLLLVASMVLWTGCELDRSGLSPAGGRDAGISCGTGIDPNVDPLNCGACGNVCPDGPNGTPDCFGGACEIRCDDGWLACDRAPGCETQGVSRTNCGQCSRACADPNPVCLRVGETADCAADCGDLTVCDGACADLQTDTSHCGGCGAACPAADRATVRCVGGACAMPECDVGFGNCDGVTENGCEQQLDVPAHCGECGMACPGAANATPTCAAGSCGLTCNPGFGDCNRRDSDGCETSLNDDPDDCGNCGTSCPSRSNATETCTGGACAFTCDADYGDCNGVAPDGCEADLTSDDAHCSACRRACGVGFRCSGSTCVCGGTTPCSGGCLCPTMCDCDLDCPSGGDCRPTCMDRCTLRDSDLNNVTLVCEAGATCTVDVDQASNLTVSCRSGSTCHVMCQNVSNCFVDCRSGASCIIECQSGTSNCDFMPCGGSSRNCPGTGNSIRTCGGASCP